MTTTATMITLAARPEGAPTEETFAMKTAELPDPAKGEVLVRSIWLSLDPYMRGRMNASKSYADPIPVGGMMTGEAVGEVMASAHPDHQPGDIVVGPIGWTSHALIAGDELRHVDPTIAPIQTALGVLGMPGMTAWVALNDIGGGKAGETVVVSAATGAVGSVLGQLAKARGMRVVGVAGGAEKCAWATDTLGFDACVDHRADDFEQQLAAATPQGVDAYYEHTGGRTLTAVLPQMNMYGRIVVIGMIAWYNGANMDQTVPLPAVWRSILTNRLRVQGMLVFDHHDRRGAFLKETAPLVSSGKLIYRETVAEGLETAPRAFIDMLTGGNFGKQLVRVGPDPA